MEKYLYFGVLLFAISYPLAQSFEHRIEYATKWGQLFPGMLITALLFIVWDIWFTKIGVWEFNHTYITGFLWVIFLLKKFFSFLSSRLHVCLFTKY